MQKNPTCPNCCRSFGTQDPARPHGPRIPLLLGCGHTFCEGCLSKFGKSKKSVHCPKCEIVTPLGDNGIKELHPDIYILGLLSLNRKYSHEGDLILRISKLIDDKARKEKRRKKKLNKLDACTTEEAIATEALCDECGKKAASCHCVKCESSMCGVCFDKVHKASKILMKHQAIPLHLEKSSVAVTCTEHAGRKLDLYCDDDEKPICTNCAIWGHHKNHRILSMEEKNMEVAADIEPAVHVAKETMGKLKSADKVLSDAIPEVKHQVSFLLSEIRAYFRLLHALLQIREQKLVEELEEAGLNKIDPLEDMKDSISINLKKLSLLIEDVQKAKKAGSELVLNAKELVAKLSTANDIPCYVVPAEGCDKFTFSFDKTVVKSLVVLGTVEGSTAPRYTLKCFNELPVDWTPPPIPTRTLEIPTIQINDDGEKCIAASLDADTDKFETESNQSESTVISNVSSKGKGLKLSPRCRIARKLARNAHASKACCELVSVTHIKSPCHFMIQRCSDHDKFESMRRAINKHCNDVKAELVEDVDVGELFCSQYNVDRHWYRARVKSIVDTNDNDSGEEMVEVVYVDYGNTEIVPISRLRKLKTKYLNSPELAVHCSLVDIVPTEGDTWSDEVRLAFAQMVSNKPVLMTVVNHIGGMLYVDLQKPPSDDIDNDVPVSVRDAMVFLELANFVSPASKPLPGMPRLTPPRKFIQPSVPKKEDFVDSLVSHISSPDTIYIQKLLPELTYLTSLMHEMQTTFNKDRGDVWQILLPQIGMICAAKYDMDNAWYRAQIIGLPGKRQVEVIYVDYGNTEIIDTTKLQKIPDDFCRLEVQALKCTLADITPVEDDWTENARVRLHSLVQNKSLVAHVQEVTDNIPSIVLYDTSSKVDVCINAVLVSEDLATSTGPGSVSSKAVTKPAPMIEKSEDSEDECSPVGPVGTAHKHPAKYKPKVIPPDHLSYTQVLVSHIESPSCIYVQLATAEEDGLDCLMKMMTAHYNQIAGEPKADMEWKQGVICAALFVQGDVWCRARLCTLLPGNLCLVLYIDYGNSEVTSMSNIRVLQEEFKKPPPFAMCCSLAGIQPAGGKDWTKTACEFLVTLICGVECYLIGKDSDGSGDGDSNTLPIDLLYEMPEEVTDLTEDPEPVLISAAKTLTLQGLALPVKMKPGQEASSDRLSVAILGKKIEENSAEKSKVNKMVSSPDVLENKAVSLLKLEQGNDVILLEEDKHSDHSNDDIGIFDDADDSESEEEDKDSGEKESDMSDDISTHTEIEKADTDMPVLATDATDGSDDEPATKAGDVAGMATRESRSEEDTSNVVTSISPDSEEREHYKPSDLPKSNVITLSVTYVDSTGMIYGHQITQGNKTLLQVMENLQTKFEDSLPSPSDYEWQIGQPCSALFTEDMHWYRAKILDITDQGVEVSYIDFGNTETVQKHNLRLEAVDLEIPQQCLQCVLHGITPNSGSGQWCKEAIYFLIETLLGNIVTVLIKKPAMIGEPLQVDVQTENSASLSQVMVHQGWARCFSDSIDIKDVNANPMKSVYKQPTLPDVGTFFSISVTQINNPAEICFQRLGPKGKGDNAASGAVHQYEELERISSEMNKRADEFELIENPVPGMACCGQYTFDDEWYRAEILKVKSVSPLKVEVTYVDYGTAETIGVDRLRKLPDEFKALPMQAIKSELIGLKPPTQVPDGVAMVADTNWPQGSQLAMTNLVMAKRLIACIMEVGSPVKVLLYQSLPSDKGSSLAFQPLVEQGLAELDVTTINQFIKEFPNIVSHSKMAATRAASPTAP